MSIFGQLDHRSPRADKYYDLSVEHSATLAEATRLYWLHTSTEAARHSARPRGDVATSFRLMKRFRLNMAAAVGYYTLIETMPTYDKQAVKHALLAAVYAFAARNESLEIAERALRDEIVAFTEQHLELLMRLAPSQSLAATINLLREVEYAGFRRKPYHPPFVMVIGMNWCPDTTRVAEITNAFRIPVQLMFAEYIRPEEDKGRRKYGVLMTNDHAQALFEDFYQQENPSTPVLRYPNGVVQQEPSTDQLIAQLVDNALL